MRDEVTPRRVGVAAADPEPDSPEGAHDARGTLLHGKAAHLNGRLTSWLKAATDAALKVMHPISACCGRRLGGGAPERDAFGIESFASPRGPRIDVQAATAEPESREPAPAPEPLPTPIATGKGPGEASVELADRDMTPEAFLADLRARGIDASIRRGDAARSLVLRPWSRLTTADHKLLRRHDLALVALLERDMTMRRLACHDCGTRFELSRRHVDWYETMAKRRGWTGCALPRRCPACRWRRREAGKAADLKGRGVGAATPWPEAQSVHPPRPETRRVPAVAQGSQRASGDRALVGATSHH